MSNRDLTTVIDEALLGTVSIDRLHRLLSHSHRRFVLAALSRSTETVTLATLAEELADRDGDTYGPTAASGKYAIKVGLYHVHIPMLAEADLVEFDSATTTVSPPEDDPTPRALAPLLPSPE